MTSGQIFYMVTGERPARRKARRWSPRKPARNWRYRGWIRTLPSAVSGQEGCEAAHTGADGGMSMKSSDYSCVPLTVEEHREYHRIGQDGMEQKYGVSFTEIVKSLNRVWFKYSQEVK